MTDLKPEPPPVYLATQDYVRAEFASMESRIERTLRDMQADIARQQTEMSRQQAEIARQIHQESVATRRWLVGIAIGAAGFGLALWRMTAG